MTAEAIIALLSAIPQLITAATQVASEFNATASAEDQASVNLALSAAQTAANAALATAIVDLNTAA